MNDNMRSKSTCNLPAVQTIFVWDFDWTIVNCNSDEYVPSQFLGDKVTTDRFRIGMKDENYGPTRWHECVSAVISSCLEETECTKDDLLEAAAAMPFLTEVRESLRNVNKNKQCGQAIISDGNDLFIGAFLERNNMSDYFTHGIETNSGTWENTNGSEGTNATVKLNITYQSAKFGGHHCKNCPPNLCKSQSLLDILDRIEQGANSRPRIVYIGDGTNDACPALCVLEESDILLARCGKKRRDPNSLSGSTSDVDSTEGHGRHEYHPEMHADEFEAHTAGAFPILSALRKAKINHGSEPRCKVYAWRSGKHLNSLITQILDGTLITKGKRI